MFLPPPKLVIVITFIPVSEYCGGSPSGQRSGMLAVMVFNPTVSSDIAIVLPSARLFIFS